MSTTPLSQCTVSTDLLGEFSLPPRADIILRSCDSHDFRVQKLYVVDSSPVLGERIMAITSQIVKPEATVDGETLLPVVQLPESHPIISSLLSFLYPVPPVLPPTIELTLELLSVAQKYRATTALTRIRDCAFRRDPKLISSETALRMYALAWKYGLREEALLAANETLKSPMSIPDFEDKPDIMPGAALGELWRYRQRVRDNLDEALSSTDSEVYQSLVGMDCVDIGDYNLPRWLDDYLNSAIGDLVCLDITTFHLALSSHTLASEACRHCKSIAGETIRKFWSALIALYRECIRKAESDVSLTQGEVPSLSSILATIAPEALLPNGLNMQGADVILQSCDLVSFRVHKSTMAISSPFFNDLFFLPQPPDGEAIDGLPVVHVPEDAEVLHSLLTLLYPIPSALPNSYEKTLALLAASQKYNMDTVSSTIRREIVLPTTEAAFHAYAIASSKQLTPETETAAHLTLDHPMTFEAIIDALPSFEGSALDNLIRFRMRCRDNLLSFLVGLLDGSDTLLKAWYNCRRTKRPHSVLQDDKGVLAGWFHDLVSRHIKNLQETYTCPLPNSSSLRKEFTKALRAHISATRCTSCSNLYATEGEALRDKFLREVSKARKRARIFLPSRDCGSLGNSSDLTLDHQTPP